MLTDRLIELFELQYDLQTETYGHNFQRMLATERVQYVKDMKLALDAELQEALDETAWKPWVQPRGKWVNRDAYVGEMVDALHFFINMLLVLGDDPADLATEVADRYAQKHRINRQRQADGYDGKSTKCPICKRALDDPAVNCNTTKVDRAPEPVLSGYCGAEGSHYYWIDVYTDKPMTILWPLCGGCNRGIGSSNRYPDGLICTKNGDQGYCAVTQSDINYVSYTRSTSPTVRDTVES